ncbi:MAG: rsmI [Betaproteobacteria bacterium]|nr:rsmI [Betaproteobacteria bacterium]
MIIAATALHLIPVTLGAGDAHLMLPPSAIQAACRLDYFLAENAKTARQFLKSIGHPRPLREVQIECFDKDSSLENAVELLKPLLAGRSAGVLSEAGSPAIADPGALLVTAAHQLRIRVVPHVGPSAIGLALMASGFNGQHFSFNGYLPVPNDECRRSIVALERESREHDVTQIFIETPYRNDQLLQAFLETCAANTRLCVASDLTLSTESVRSATIAGLKKESLEIGRRPSVFLLYAK